MSEISNLQALFLIFSFTFVYLISDLLIPIINKIGITFNFKDFKDFRKKHEVSLVRVGGIGIFISFFFIIFLNYFLNIIPIDNSLLITISVGSVGYFSLGLIDDLFNNLSAYIRLIFQILIALLVIFIYFSEISTFYFFNYNFEINNFFIIIISLLWIVGIVNAINWTDGLDGLLAGNTFVYSLSIIFISLARSNFNSLFFGLILLGSILSFLSERFCRASMNFLLSSLI